MKQPNEVPEGAQYWDDGQLSGEPRWWKLDESGWSMMMPLVGNWVPRNAPDNSWLQRIVIDDDHYVDANDMVKRSKYHREIKPGVWIDVYDVIKAWAVDNPAQQHLIKKALQAGDRGHKSYDQDMEDIIASAVRAKQLNAE